MKFIPFFLSILLAANVAVADTSPSTISPAQSSSADLDASINDSIKAFKEAFNIDVNKDTIQQAAIKTLTDYNAKLKTCTSGTYKFAMINEGYGHRENGQVIPMLIINTTVIQGMQNNTCGVILQPNTPDESDCQFSQNSLDFMSTSQLGTGDSIADLNSVDKFSQILDQQCKDKSPQK